MRQVTLNEIKTMAIGAKETIWAQAESIGREPKIYAHWTAGHYDQTFPDYHFNITGDGAIYTDLLDMSEILPHTYRRNTGAVGIALCCAYQAHSVYDLGSEPPTDIQIEILAQVIAVLTEAINVPIDIEHVMTHAEAADNMDGDSRWYIPYGPNNNVERWDLWVLKEGEKAGSGGETMRGKAIFYQQQNTEKGEI